MSFENQISRFIDDTIGNIQAVIEKAVLDMFNEIVQGTPVDTGRARGNWFLNLNNPRLELIDGASYDKSGGATISNAAGELGKFDTDTNIIFITNNLPYIRRLEYGYSPQAPNGFTRLAVQRFNQNIQRIARAIK